jgi:nucleotide-binding universal stress UspA family protein
VAPIVAPRSTGDAFGMVPQSLSVERVVCGVGRSPTAQNVFAVAAGLAERLRSRLALVHVAGHQFRVGADREALLEAGHQHLATVADGHRVYEPIVQLGDPLRKLIASASQEATLLVIGSGARRFPWTTILGSISNRLAAECTCPVVVVSPGSERWFQTRIRVHSPAIVCAVDDSPVGETVLLEAARLTEQLGGRLVATHVRPDSVGFPLPGARPVQLAHAYAAEEVESEEALEVLGRAMRQLSPGVRCDVRLGFGDVAACINEVAVEEDAALVVVGSKRRRSLRSALLGSVSTRLVKTSTYPVCTVSRSHERDETAGTR